MYVIVYRFFLERAEEVFQSPPGLMEIQDQTTDEPIPCPSGIQNQFCSLKLSIQERKFNEVPYAAACERYPGFADFADRTRNFANPKILFLGADHEFRLKNLVGGTFVYQRKYSPCVH